MWLCEAEAGRDLAAALTHVTCRPDAQQLGLQNAKSFHFVNECIRIIVHEPDHEVSCSE